MKKLRITGIRPLSPVGLLVAVGTVATIWGFVWALIITQ